MELIVSVQICIKAISILTHRRERRVGAAGPVGGQSRNRKAPGMDHDPDAAIAPEIALPPGLKSTEVVSFTGFTNRSMAQV
jgi:hypothetical protein